jgi:hypothetical protein
MLFETGFIVLRKYLRWPTQLLASAYGYMVKAPTEEQQSGLRLNISLCSAHLAKSRRVQS